MAKVISLILYYMNWVLLIRYVNDRPTLIAAVVVGLIVQLMCFYRGKFSARYFLLVTIMALFGWLADSVISLFGVASYYGESYTVAPVEFALLWLSFMLMFNQFFANYYQNTTLWVILAVIFFPLTYYLGCHLGAGVYSNLTVFVFSYAFFGALFFVVLRYVDQFILLRRVS